MPGRPRDRSRARAGGPAGRVLRAVRLAGRDPRRAPASARRRRGGPACWASCGPTSRWCRCAATSTRACASWTTGEADAIVLAAAGLVRLGLLEPDRLPVRPVRVRARGRAGRAGGAGAERRGAAGVVARPRAVAPARRRRARPGRGAGRRLHGAGGGARLVRAGRAACAVVGGAVTVYLVGAGPGDPGLLTVRGARAAGPLRRAGLRPAGRSRGSWRSPPASAERVYAGKPPDRHALSQEQINALLVELARPAACVVRLKGGDPFVFGRGGEEALALARPGIALRGGARHLVGLRGAGLRGHPGHAARASPPRSRS